jgi:2-polyprenyl-3-methyl-5-hydroxy-6-metoxy-1,4-benzoquinol methylase
MRLTPGSTGSPGEPVERYFDAEAPYWRDVYAEAGLQGLIYRQRMELALRWIEQLGPAAGSEALEVGAGAGLLSVALARRGLRVTSTDSSSEMVALTEALAEREGQADAVAVELADAHRLEFASGRFSLVVALGVLPWLHDPARAVREMSRVLAAGGLLVLSADNALRLNVLLGQNPLLEPPKAAYRALARRRGAELAARSRLDTPARVGRMVRSAGLRPVQRASVGFGPLTLGGRPLLAEPTALRLHGRLQELADRDLPLIRSLGWHVVLAAVKPPAQLGA